MRKILAIDDQRDNLITVKAVIKSNLAHCNVITALSGKEGIKMAREEQPDTILLDIIMPEMDGFEVCKKLKADDLTKHIPVIMLTAIKTDSESRVKGLNLGADAFLAKPIDSVELTAQVNVMLRIKKAEDKLRAEKENLEELVSERTKDLRTSEGKHKSILNAMDDSVFVLDKENRFVSFYAPEQELYKPSSEFLGKTHAEIMPANIDKLFTRALQKVMEGKAAEYEFSFDLPDGKHWYEIKLSAINEDGKYSGLTAVSRDISARKLAEIAVQKNEEKLRLMIDNSPVGVSTTDLEGHFVEVNPTLCEMTGYTKNEMIGKHFNQFSHPHDTEKNVKLFNKLIEGEITYFDIEKRYIHKNKNIINVFIRAQLIRDNKGNPLFQTAIIEDVTERKKAEELLIKQEARIRSIFRSAPVGIGVVSNRMLLQVNNHLCEMTGYEADELFNQNSNILYPTKKEYERVGKFKYDQIEELGTGTVETQWKRKDGKIIDVLLSSTPIDRNDWSVGVTFSALDITERNLAEKQLRENEHKFRLLADNTYDWEYWIDPDGNYIYLSQACERITGYSPNEFQKSPELLFKLVHPDYAEKVYKHYHGELEMHEPIFNFEFPIIHRNGEVRWLEHNCTPVFNTEGVFLGRRGNNRDITERLQAQEALKEGEERYKDLVEKARIAVLIDDKDGKFTYFNETFCNIFGYSEEEIKVRSIQSLVHPDDVDRVMQLHNKHLRGEQKSSRYEFKGVKKDGSIIHLEVDALELKDNEEVVGTNSYLWDITERKLAEETLKENEQKLRNIFENSTNLFYSHTPEHVNTYLSPQVKDILGYSQEEAMVHWTEFVSDNPINELGYKITEKAIKTGKRQASYELELIKKNGEKIWVEVREYPQTENGKTVAIIGSLTEITERKKAEQIQNVLYNISQAAITSKSIEDLITIIQKQLGKIIDTKNFYIAFYDEKTDTFSSAYISDEKDRIETWPAGKSYSAYVLKTGKSLLVTKDDAEKMRVAGEIINVGVPSEIWLGVPLFSDGVAKGVLAVQSYTNKNAYSLNDCEMLEFVASQISTSLERKNAEYILKESEERYRMLSKLTFEGIVLHENGIIVDINLSGAKMFGYEHEEIVGKEVFDFIDKKDKPKIIENLRKSYSLPYELEGVKKDGTKFPIEIEGRDVIREVDKIKLRVAAIRDLTERKKAEQIQNVLYNISNAVTINENLELSIGRIQKGLGSIIDTSNFYVALYDKKTDSFSLPFFADERDKLTSFPKGKTLTRFVHKTKKPLLATTKVLKQLENSGDIEKVGTDSKIWLGVPLRIEGDVMGVLAVQSYANENAFDESDMKMLEFVSDQISLTIHRKKADENIRKLSTAVEQSPSVIAITNLAGNFEYVNPKFTELTGFNSDEVIGENARILKSGEQSNEFYEKFWQTINAGNEWHGEFHNKKKDGRYFWEAASVSPILNEDGEIINYIKVAEDISERKRSEQIQQVVYNISEAAISSQNFGELINAIQKQLGSIINTNNFYIAFYDKETDVFSSPFVSDEKDDLTSWPAGKSLSSYVVKNIESLLITKEEILKMNEEGKVDLVGVLSEVWLGVPLIYDGIAEGVFAVQSYTDKNAFAESDMKMLEFVSDQISTSIHRKKAEEDLKTALVKATESDRLKSAFLATMSHELRTPLNAIIGFSEFLDRDLPTDDVVKFGEIINTSGNHLLSIVNDLFDITLIEAGETKVTKEEVTLGAILYDVQTVVEEKQQRNEKGNIELKLIFPPGEEDFKFKTDENKIKQILINLLKNALKFTEEGHIHFGCEIVADQILPFLKFYVKDTGIGISKDKQELIFDIFRQVEDSNTRRYGGTGIGLSVAKRLTELLGGKIWLESEINKGSSFYFTIPFEKPENSIQAESEENAAKKENKSKTILIVEDDEASVKLIEVVFSHLEINFIWVENGEEAIQHCRENPEIDLVLMDINLPVLNGFKATKEIRKFLPNLPIIAQTAFAIAGDRENSLDAGCDDYISKPINKNELLEMIAKYI